VNTASPPRQTVRLWISVKLLDEARAFGIDPGDGFEEHLAKVIAARRAGIKTTAHTRNARNKHPTH
jgi:hypothetical protein